MKYEQMRVKSGWKEIHFLCWNQILSTLRLSPKRKEGKSDAKVMQKLESANRSFAFSAVEFISTKRLKLN